MNTKPLFNNNDTVLINKDNMELAFVTSDEMNAVKTYFGKKAKVTQCVDDINGEYVYKLDIDNGRFAYGEEVLTLY